MIISWLNLKLIYWIINLSLFLIKALEKLIWDGKRTKWNIIFTKIEVTFHLLWLTKNVMLWNNYVSLIRLFYYEIDYLIYYMFHTSNGLNFSFGYPFQLCLFSDNSSTFQTKDKTFIVQLSDFQYLFCNLKKETR